jgi:ribosomal protein L31
MITHLITDDEDGNDNSNGVLDLSVKKRLPVLLSPPSSTTSSSSSSSSIISPKRILPTGKRMLDLTPLIPSPPSKIQPTNKRPLRFQCKHCDYKAPSTSLMQNHIYRHTDLTPYACAYCGHKSTTKSTIMVHIELCHPNMEVKILENRVREQDFYRDLNNSEITTFQFQKYKLKKNFVQINMIVNQHLLMV